MITGIDVSSCQSKIDWNSIAASGKISFAGCKATEGIGFTDPQFINNWSGIKSINMPRMAYHFARTKNDPIKEADYFISVIPDLALPDMLCLDIEQSTLAAGPAFIEWVLAWLKRVEEKTNIIPIVYSGGPFFDAQDHGVSDDLIKQLSHFPFWLAAYVSGDPSRFVPKAFANEGWKFWQCAGNVGTSAHPVMHLPGTNIVVDCDLFNGTLDDLKAFAYSLSASTTATFATAEQIPV